ncbi:Uncharacterised protein [Streptococcus uberis]|uniref:hypothetical protein n=1 Tax=Streptococcus uberis TaxID=1349 RepID=UPI000DA2C255|nr:hypothetical protein [Streptococcus uberis]MCK1244901.1 hypothetical protein [Streptococcus uberis]SQG83690.1 Uncharacterised protein [Streptococcus uberis]
MSFNLDFIKIFKDFLTQPVALGTCILVVIVELFIFLEIFKVIRKNHSTAFDSLEKVNENLIKSMESKDKRISELEGKLHATFHKGFTSKENSGGN